MRQFQVPQFINIEDRIIGPLTLRQFLYLLGGAAVVVLGWAFLHIFLFILVVVPIAGLFAALAFVKISGRPLPTIVIAAINYYLKPRLYLWKKAPPSPSKIEAGRSPKQPPSEPTPLSIPKLTESKLSDLAWSLDIKEKLGDRE